MTKNDSGIDPKVKTKTIKVDYLARVEGEGALHITTKGNKLQDVKLKIFEPPRFFEAFLQGRHCSEASDITARICGICPVAYQMSAVHALEKAFSVTVPDNIRQWRRLLYCGEWIESHTLHMTMLHAPDFLGFSDAITMAKKHKERVEMGLRIKKSGNSLLKHLGGREIHPINVKLGGFYSLPQPASWRPVLSNLQNALEDAWELFRWISTFHFPDLEIDYDFISLSHPREYPMNEGGVVSSRGLNISQEDFEEYFEEFQVEHSNALHCRRRGGASYMTGPMARFANCSRQLPDDIRHAAEQEGLSDVCKNPYRSIQLRALEVIFAIGEAIRIIEQQTSISEQPANTVVTPGKAVGCGITEAPRGILFHRYNVNEEGLIDEAKIIPPTSQNQMRIEEDLRIVIEECMDFPVDKLRHRCEQTIRNYDPCISCATHFLDLTVERL